MEKHLTEEQRKEAERAFKTEHYRTLSQALVMALYRCMVWRAAKSGRINPIRGCNVIKIREFLSTNHVYARDEDFDFVYNFIKDRCPRVK